MDGELVTDSPSGGIAAGGSAGRQPAVRYGEKFEELCGQYMALGMSYQDYWDGDCMMAKYYREAGEYRRERENFNAWLHGLYIYTALLKASPVLNPMSKRKTPHKFLEAPIPITERAKERADEEENRRNMDKSMNIMRAWMAGVNAKFKRKGGENDGG